MTGCSLSSWPREPSVFYFLAVLHHFLLFSTPFFLILAGMSVLYIVRPTPKKRIVEVVLPPFPPRGDELRLVIGECHHARVPEP